MSRFLSAPELEDLGFAGLGEAVSVDRSAIFISPERITLGSRCRIDAFGLVSAGDGVVVIGNNVHLGAGVQLYGGGDIRIADFAGLSPRSMVFSQTEDTSGASMTNPTLPPAFRRVRSGPVQIGRHALVGAGAVILPGVVLGEAAIVGALSLVKHDVAPFTIVAGTPARAIGHRASTLLELEAAYLASVQASAQENVRGQER